MTETKPVPSGRRANTRTGIQVTDMGLGLRTLVSDGQSQAEFALRFVRSDAAVSTVILGARDGRQSAANAAAGLAPLLSPEERAAVDRLVPPRGGRRIWPA